MPSVTRRQFIARSLLAGAGLLAGCKSLGGRASTDPNAWALLSDIHLAADRSTVARKINMAENFEQVSREVLRLERLPKSIFITGDLAYNSGQVADYGTVGGLLQPLREAGFPIHLALGNHDNRENFWQAFTAEKMAARPVQERQTALIKTPRANWFILDSLEKTLATPGILGKAQLDWLAQALDANPNKPALVLLHHNPGVDANFGLKDTAYLFDVIRPRKHVKAYIYGHTHTWKVEQDPSGIHLVNLPPVAYVFQEGQPSGWVHMHLRGDGMQLELRCIDTSHRQHGEQHDLKWRA